MCFTSVLLKKIYPGQPNDGLVPNDSGKLENYSIKTMEYFAGFDHYDMKSDGTSNTLFPTLEARLRYIAETKQKVDFNDNGGLDDGDLDRILKVLNNATPNPAVTTPENDLGTDVVGPEEFEFFLQAWRDLR